MRAGRGANDCADVPADLLRCKGAKRQTSSCEPHTQRHAHSASYNKVPVCLWHSCGRQRGLCSELGCAGRTWLLARNPSWTRACTSTTLPPPRHISGGARQVVTGLRAIERAVCGCLGMLRTQPKPLRTHLAYPRSAKPPWV